MGCIIFIFYSSVMSSIVDTRVFCEWSRNLGKVSSLRPWKAKKHEITMIKIEIGPVMDQKSFWPPSISLMSLVFMPRSGVSLHPRTNQVALACGSSRLGIPKYDVKNDKGRNITVMMVKIKRDLFWSSFLIAIFLCTFVSSVISRASSDWR